MASNIQLSAFCRMMKKNLTSVFSSGSLVAYVSYNSLLRLSTTVVSDITTFYVSAPEGGTTEAAENAMTRLLMERFDQDDDAFSVSSQNALVSMSICLLMLYFLKLVQEKCGTMASVLQLLIVLAAVIWAALFRAAYGLCLILLVAIFYVFYGKNGIKTLLGVVVSLLYVTGPLAFYGIYCYNGQRRNRIPKYVYYVFYPLHLLVLGLIVKYLMA